MTSEANLVFISYAHEDLDVVQPLAAYLRELDLTVWIDTKNLRGGDSLPSGISEAIARVDLYIVCISPNALKSKWVLYELDIAITLEVNQGRPKIIPILVREGELPAMLVSRRYVDISASLDNAKHELLQTIYSHLGMTLGAPRQDEDHSRDAEGIPERLAGSSLVGSSLRGADLRRRDLRYTDLRNADLSEADLRDADLRNADLSSAQLDGARLNRALLTAADFRGANLSRADLESAVLQQTNFMEANLDGTNLSSALLGETILGNVDLSSVKGLESIDHQGPSMIDERTRSKSWPLPEVFLRGCGLSDQLIEYLPALFGHAIEFYSCFISYSSKDEQFAQRLHADLQAEGVRCWFAPEDLRIGEQFRLRIDEAIRLHDKLLLILSEHSVESPWVEHEVESAFEKEFKTRESGRNRTVLFPIRLDSALMRSRKGWAATIRRTRHIGDFSAWKDHDAYKTAFQRLLRDLKSGGSEPGGD